MYAINSTGYRAITSQADVQAGETFASTVPQSLIDSLASAAAARDTNATTLRQQADTALVNLRAYRDNAAPTNAQTVAAVKTLCRVCIALIRLQLAKLDAAD